MSDIGSYTSEMKSVNETINIAHVHLSDYGMFEDPRGVNTFPFVASTLSSSIGRKFNIAQLNVTYTQKNTFRGIHVAAVPPGQGKYVWVIDGMCIDILVDLRVGSPTEGNICTIPLSAHSGYAIYVPEGVGHGILCENTSAIVGYACNQEYNPQNEFGINPYDPQLGLKLQPSLILSEKDRNAPFLSEVHPPHYQDCLKLYHDHA